MHWQTRLRLLRARGQPAPAMTRITVVATVVGAAFVVATAVFATVRGPAIANGRISGLAGASGTGTAPSDGAPATPTTAGPGPVGPAGSASAAEGSPVGVTDTLVVDPTRPGTARGPLQGSDARALAVTIWYPARTDGHHASPAAGVFPLVVFAHGFAASAQTYTPLLHDLAAAGFVVAVPEFPMSSTAYAGGPEEGDLPDQARDVAVVARSLLDPAARPTGLPALDRSGYAAVGHSDGAVTVLGAGYSACCADPAVKVVVALSGALVGFDGPWFAGRLPPLLAVHGTDDDVNPFDSSRAVVARSPGRALLVGITGGGHLDTFVADATRPAVVGLVAGYVRDAFAAA